MDLNLEQTSIYIDHEAVPSDLIIVGGMVIQSISDGSAAIVPMLTWSMFEDAELLTYVNINTGDDGQAYAANSGSGGIVRLRVYF